MLGVEEDKLRHIGVKTCVYIIIILFNLSIYITSLLHKTLFYQSGKRPFDWLNSLSISNQALKCLNKLN
jgi:hypothetical protein